MKTKEDRDKLLLAIYPTTRGFGFVVFEGRDRTIDWGVKDARGDKNRKALAKIEELVAWYRPDMLVLENAHGPMSRRADRIRQLNVLVIEFAKARRIPVRQWMSENRWLGMFDAAALALTFYDTQNNSRANCTRGRTLRPHSRTARRRLGMRLPKPCPASCPTDLQWRSKYRVRFVIMREHRNGSVFPRC
jgi:hypothetical protein